MALTRSDNLIIPEVLADMVQYELEKKIRFTPLAQVDTTLVGQPGDTITVPAWGYIGDAEDLTEGEEIEISQMSTTDKTMTIKQIGKAVEVTDYALEVSYDDALQAAASQIALSHAQKIDEDFVNALRLGAELTETADSLTVDNLEKAIAVFDDEDLSDMVLITNPQNAINLTADARKLALNTEVGGQALISGAFAKVLGATVVRSKRLQDNEAFLIKAGALRLVKKRDVFLETDRDILKKSTVISADSIYGTYVFDSSKLVKVNIGGSSSAGTEG